MSAISAVWLYVGWGAVHFETNYGLMQHSPFEIKEKLLKALDKEYNVVDMAAVVEIVSILERTAITKEALETTRLGRYINELRRKTSNDSLARRAKDLVRRWRDMILPTSGATAAEQPPAAAPSSGGATQPPPPPVAQNGSSGVRAPRIQSPATSPVQQLSGATHDTASVPRTHASNKRLRKEVAPPLDAAAPPPPPAKKPKLNGASLPVPAAAPPPPPPDECSRDSGATNECEIVTIVDDDDDELHQTDTDSKLSSSKTKKSRQKDKKSSNLTSTSSSEKRRSKSDKKRLGGDDILKEKIASIARTPRVKTTQELVADLRSRRNSETAATVDSDVKVVAADAACDELVLSRNKTEHIEKFLRSQKQESDDDSVVVVDLVEESEASKKKGADGKERSTKDHKRSKQAAGTDQSESSNPERTLQEILSRLPPLDVDSIVWDESPPVSPPPPREITLDDVDRLHNENVENLNGNYDHAPTEPLQPHSSTTDGTFREWHETVSRTSYNGELLHILPYVVID